MEVEQLKQLHAHELLAIHSAHEMTLSQARYDRSELRHQQAVAAAHHHLLTTGAGEASPALLAPNPSQPSLSCSNSTLASELG